MLTKYYLYIDGQNYEVKSDDLKNWADIKWSYKRDDYGGVVRSFTSRFEFVNRAYRLLQDLYMRDGVDSQATITVCVLDNRWRIEKQFECPLDFSSVSWEGGIFKINGVDDGLSSKIKANKSTKYEFGVGTDISPDDNLCYDRIIMRESLTYEISGGESSNDSADILVTWEKGTHLWIGNVGSEIAAGTVISWNDEQDESAYSYLFKAKKDVGVTLNYTLAHRFDGGNGAVDLYCRIKRRSSTVYSFPLGTFANDPGLKFVGTFIDSDSLLMSVPTPTNGQWALIDGIVWMALPIHVGLSWENTGLAPEKYFLSSKSGDITFDLKAGDIVSIECETQSANDKITVRVSKSEFKFTWAGRGDELLIDVFRPETIGNALLNKLAGDDMQYSVDINRFDPRLNNTRLMAGESVRQIKDAKFYSSFNEFCDWMETVFGYIYYIGDVRDNRFVHYRKAGDVVGTPYPINKYPYNISPEDVDPAKIIFISPHSQFAYYGDDGMYYLYWPGSEDYNNPDTGNPRIDTVFGLKYGGVSGNYYFDETNDGVYTPIRFVLDINKIGLKCQTVHFVHRSEFFKINDEVIEIADASEVKYSIDNSRIFSSIVVGYDKKDYESVNGRDEFNFNNTYATGSHVNDKKLSLLSKYRADGYGIEFIALKHNEETTDSEGDKNVFFALCNSNGDSLVIDRSLEIENGYSDTLINGAFSPMACVRANELIMGMQANGVSLRFASSTGNSDIVIGGEPMTTDIILGPPTLTCGVVEFTSSDIRVLSNLNALVSICSDGIRYNGFVNDISLKRAKEDAAKYKLIVTSVEP